MKQTYRIRRILNEKWLCDLNNDFRIMWSCTFAYATKHRRDRIYKRARIRWYQVYLHVKEQTVPKASFIFEKNWVITKTQGEWTRRDSRIFTENRKFPHFPKSTEVNKVSLNRGKNENKIVNMHLEMVHHQNKKRRFETDSQRIHQKRTKVPGHFPSPY